MHTDQYIESAIIQGCKESCKDSQRRLYKEYKHSWYTICLRYLKSEADAQDALQNGLVNIFTKIHYYDSGQGTFTAWSSKVFVNECLQQLKKKKRIIDLQEEYSQYCIHEGPRSLDGLTLSELKDIILELPKGTRTVFNLYAIEGYTHKEIAQALEISEGASKSQLFYAKKLLRQRISLANEIKMRKIS